MVKEKIKKSALEFRREFKKSMLTAIIAAFGFLIALSWRDVISEWAKGLTQISPVQGKIVSKHFDLALIVKNNPTFNNRRNYWWWNNFFMSAYVGGAAADPLAERIEEIIIKEG